jgi:hypothetical protein
MKRNKVKKYLKSKTISTIKEGTNLSDNEKGDFLIPTKMYMHTITSNHIKS